MWMIFCPPAAAAAAATMTGFRPVTGDPGVRCTTITDGRFPPGVDGRSTCPAVTPMPAAPPCRGCSVLTMVPGGAARNAVPAWWAERSAADVTVTTLCPPETA